MKTVKEETVVIKAINFQEAIITLEGDTSYIPHKWSDDNQKKILDKETKKATSKGARDIKAEYKSCFYYTRDGKYGVPICAIKKAVVSAGGRFNDLVMTQLRGSFVINEGEDVAELEGEPQMRQDPVRVGNGGADIRFRPEFLKWSIRLNVKFNADKISLEQVVNLFNLAGFGVGIGDWRPEKNGQHGMFHVANG